MTEPVTHSVEFWAKERRDLKHFIVTSVVTYDDAVTITGDHGWTFSRSKADLGREIKVRDELWVETVLMSRVTGLKAVDGWLFRMTDEELAAEARQFSADMHRRAVTRFEQERKRHAQWEAELPDWLKARIQRFRDAGGEKFLLDGWGYELVICRLADLFDRSLDEEAEKLSSEEGVTGNQWDCAKALATTRRLNGDDAVALMPAGLSPLTGSADYS